MNRKRNILTSEFKATVGTHQLTIGDDSNNEKLDPRDDIILQNMDRNENDQVRFSRKDWEAIKREIDLLLTI